MMRLRRVATPVLRDPTVARLMGAIGKRGTKSARWDEDVRACRIVEETICVYDRLAPRHKDSEEASLNVMLNLKGS